MDKQNEIYVGRNQSTILLCFIGCIALFASTFWLVLSAAPAREVQSTSFLKWEQLWLGAFLIVLSFFAVWYLVKLFDRSPALKICPLGFDDRSTAICFGFIPWSAVKGIRVRRVRLQRYLMVSVQHPEVYRNRLHPVLRVFAWLNQMVYSSTIAIPEWFLDIEFDELKNEFETRFGQEDGARIKLPASE
ncbi:UNVERIFIED_ORG: hypothetical protein J2W85_001086 [Ensifer adhaerens]|nr:hypothetical protein [Ensifer adhaerens]